MLVKHVLGTCGVRAGRGGASFVETLRMVYSTHAARSPNPLTKEMAYKHGRKLPPARRKGPLGAPKHPWV